jgi:O-antigen/teichoic acid export membrane protein
MSRGRKVIINTLILYTKLLIQLFVGVFTTRLVLNSLGEVDYGIYALVAGVVGMLAFLQTTLATASGRFISISIGSGNQRLIKQTFNTSLFVHFFLGILLVIIMIVGGYFMFSNILNIPHDRIDDAKVIFYFMVVTTFVAIVSVPYDALINSHENFLALSIIELMGVILNLFAAIFITFLEANVLIIYGFLTLCIQVLMRVTKQIYVSRKYSESTIKINTYKDRNLMRRILSFASWKIFDAGSTVIYTQLKSILLNVFFGVALNAANGLANTLSHHLNNLSANMSTAINPQVIKSEGSGNRERMLKLTVTSAKFSLYMFALFSLPVFIETSYILTIWLNKVPDYTTIFVKLMIITLVLQKYSFPLTIAIQAVGKIREITIIVLLNVSIQLILTYYFFTLGYPPQTIYVIGIIMTLFSTTARIYFANRIAGLNVRNYLFQVFFKGTLPILTASIFAIMPSLFMEESFLRLILTVAVSIFASIFFIIKIGLNENEFNFLKEFALSFVNRIRKN